MESQHNNLIYTPSNKSNKLLKNNEKSERSSSRGTRKLLSQYSISNDGRHSDQRSRSRGRESKDKESDRFTD
jgi:hypothetical protein